MHTQVLTTLICFVLCCLVLADRTLDECKRLQEISHKPAYHVPVYNDCTRFAQCLPAVPDQANGIFIMGHYVTGQCPVGLFFDYNMQAGEGACQHAHMVNCEADPCRNSAVLRHADERNCNFYFICRDMRSILKRCAPSHRYDGQSGSCVGEPTCSPPTTTTTTTTTRKWRSFQ